MLQGVCRRVETHMVLEEDSATYKSMGTKCAPQNRFLSSPAVD